MEENKNTILLEEIHKELDLVQACITRMGNKSSLVKGWTYALITGIIALFGNTVNILFICGVIIVICIYFWYANAFYLKQSRLYRYKYAWIIKMRPKGIRKHLYNLDPYELEMMEDKRRYQTKPNKKTKEKNNHKIVKKTAPKIKEKLKLSKDDKAKIRDYKKSKETIRVMFDKPYTLIWFYGFPIVIALIVAICHLVKC
ncbi:MAG: hypothetical protein LBM93_01610 [Oscillospiraceae bacterium]|nr:hypothetical protein [Oscillospiraceae bacterium]